MIERAWYTLFEGTPRNFVWWEEFLAVILMMGTAIVVVGVTLGLSAVALCLLYEGGKIVYESGAWKIILPILLTATIITFIF